MHSRPLTLCVGDIDVDLMVGVSHVPAPDEKVNGRRLSLAPGGMMANAAVGIARLGLPVRLVGAVGDDHDGAFAVNAVAAEGVDVRFVARRPDTPTFMCVVMIGPAGEKSLVRVSSDAYLPEPADLTPAALEGVDHVHVTLGSPRLTEAALAAGTARGAVCSLDLEAADLPDEPAILAAALARTDYLFMSRAGAAAAQARLGATPRGRRVTITTLGADGATAQFDGRTVSVPGFRVAPADTTGAGDAFAAAFIYATHQGADAGAALAFANAAAALSTLKVGAQSGLPSVGEVHRLLAGSQGRPSA
jgi:sugar/nucleoside kinase (ribokinase family)